MGSTLLRETCLGGVEKKDEEELSWWYLEDDFVGNLVVSFCNLAVYIEDMNSRVFEVKALFSKVFKLNCLRILSNWSHVFNGGRNIYFLDFVDNIMHESLRA